jgi:alpha-galactosidase
MTSVSLGYFELKLVGDPQGFVPQLSLNEVSKDLWEVHFELYSKSAAVLPPLALEWRLPIADIHVCWRTSFSGRGFIPDWGHDFESKGTSQAPVNSLFNYAGQNRLTFAWSDVIQPVSFGAKVVEEEAVFVCSVKLFKAMKYELKEYRASLLVDLRDIPYYESLKTVSEWWETMPGLAPTEVPEHARLPMYSTWYSFHQGLDPENIERQCALAKELGCEAVIVDDGWQTDDVQRGYAHCGDWKVAKTKIPDMAEHVRHVHDLGMKYILWYSVPYVGIHSEAAKKFADKSLHYNERQEAYILDPRFPEVREYLVSTYERAALEFGLDGFKLDFVDAFTFSGEDPGIDTEGRDCDSVEEAVDTLLGDVLTRLKKINPEILLEFRQSYIGPAMRKYGNMFRAADVPNDSLTNRMHVLDIRLLCGNSAAHSDMLMWHPKDPVESAAMQIVNVLFSVPQISVLIDTLPPEHLEMLRFYLAFWRDNRDVLLDGTFMPLHPENSFPMVLAETANKLITVFYSPLVAQLPERLPETLIFVNGSYAEQMAFQIRSGECEKLLCVDDCRGNKKEEKKVLLGRGINSIDILPAGIAILN